MSAKIRGVVRRLPRVGGTENGESWLALAFTVDGEPGDVYESSFSGSHAEAMRVVHEMIAGLAGQMQPAAVSGGAEANGARCEWCGPVGDAPRCVCGVSISFHRAEHPHLAILRGVCVGYRPVEEAAA